MTETPKEIVKRLAEIRCPSCHACHGTGRRFWRLVKKCTSGHSRIISHDQSATVTGNTSCEEAGCSGLVPVEPTVELALRILDTSMGYLFSIRNTPSITMARYEVEVESLEVIYSDDLNEALWEALATAVEKEGHG